MAAGLIRVDAKVMGDNGTFEYGALLERSVGAWKVEGIGRFIDHSRPCVAPTK